MNEDAFRLEFFILKTFDMKFMMLASFTFPSKISYQFIFPTLNSKTVFFFLFSLLMVKSLPHHTQEKIRMKQIKLETVDMTSLPHPVSCFYEILWSVINEHKWAFQSTISAKIKNSLVRWELMSWWTRMKMNVKRNFFICKLLLQAVRLS